MEVSHLPKVREQVQRDAVGQWAPWRVSALQPRWHFRDIPTPAKEARPPQGSGVILLASPFHWGVSGERTHPELSAGIVRALVFTTALNSTFTS